MQSDELIWKTIAFNFCSFKIKTADQNFCRNEMNLTGLCSRKTCPLANSNYATIREHEGCLYLYVKTIERAHSPAKMWEKIKLSKNYQQALSQIDEELEFWPEHMIHRNKQRLTKLTQMLIRTRKLVQKQNVELIGVKKKILRREKTRELKALSAAKLEQSIQKELLDRLKKGVYGDGILNESQEAFANALNELEQENEEEQDVEFEDLEEEDDFEREFVSDFSDSDGDSEGEDNSEKLEDDSSANDSSSDESDSQDKKSKKKKQKRGPYVNVEYEEEQESHKQAQSLEW